MSAALPRPPAGRSPAPPPDPRRIQTLEKRLFSKSGRKSNGKPTPSPLAVAGGGGAGPLGGTAFTPASPRGGGGAGGSKEAKRSRRKAA